MTRTDSDWVAKGAVGALAAALLIGGWHLAADPLDGTHLVALNQVRDQFGRIDSAHAAYSYRIWLRTDEGIEKFGRARLEYWESGGAFRINTFVDPDLGLLRSFQLAWDGERFELYDPQDDLLMFQSSLPAGIPVALPNPFFLPVSFLSDDSDDCQGCMLRLRDLQDERAWQEKLAGARSVERGPLDASSQVIETPAVRISGRDVRRRVSVSQHGVPTQIDWLDDRGKHLLSIEMSDHRSLPAGATTIDLPYRMELVSHDDAGDLSLWIDIETETAELNTQLDQNVFSIDRDPIGMIWNNEQRRYERNAKTGVLDIFGELEARKGVKRQ